MTLSADYSLSQAKTQIAKVLLENANEESKKQTQLVQRDMASQIGVRWEVVHASLRCLESEGAIKVERHKIIINKELLNKLANND